MTARKTRDAGSRSPGEAGRSIWRDLITVLVVFGSAWLIPLAVIGVAMLVARPLVWLLATAASYAGAIGWLVLLPVVGWLGLEVHQRMSGRGAAERKGGAKRGRLIAAASTGALVIAGNGCLNVAASRADQHWESRKQHGVDIYRNHDLAALVGQCVRLSIQRFAQQGAGLNNEDAAALRAIAKTVQKRWQALTATEDERAGAPGKPDPRVAALSDARLPDFIAEDAGAGLKQSEWLDLLKEWRGSDEAPSDATLDATAEFIAKDFGRVLREALKADFEAGGKAWAAMQLDIARRLIAGAAKARDTKDPEYLQGLGTLNALLKDNETGLPALRRLVSDLSVSGSDHAMEVLRQFSVLSEAVDRLCTTVEEIKGDVKVVKADVGQIKSGVQAADQKVSAVDTRTRTIEGKVDQLIISVQKLLDNGAVFTEIRRVAQATELAAPQKQAQLEQLLAQIIANQPADAPPVNVPAAVREDVVRMFATAPAVARLGASVRVGAEVEARAIVSVIEQGGWGGLPEDQRYAYALARGDAAWRATDYGPAAEWYRRAMELRVDEAAAVVRAAKSVTLAPGKASYSEDVRDAQGWIERCLLVPRAEGETGVVETAQLKAVLAVTLALQGRVGDAAQPAREALELLSGLGDRPAPQVYEALIDSANALRDADAPAEASAAAERALAAATEAGGPDSAATALAYASRASIREESRKFSEAMSDLAVSIAWGEKQTPRDERLLAIRYAARASIRLGLGESAEAERDITSSIRWGEAQPSLDERGLAMRYALRARIRLERRDLAGAKTDIDRSIRWAESQASPDCRSLAIRSLIRARILRAQGDLAGAEDDLRKCLDWARRQTPPNESGLISAYGMRAQIRRDRGDLSNALADIEQSIAIGKRRSPRNESQLAIDHATRASIRHRMEDLDGALADLTASIESERLQKEPNQRELALRQTQRAQVRYKLGLFEPARTDIEAALAWWTVHDPHDKRTIDLLEKTKDAINRAGPR